MLDHLLKPNDPQTAKTEVPIIQPGIVLSLDDPEKLGRVRVSCPLIDENNPIPNNNDGWVPMLNLSSGGGSPGGTQALIHVNDQVLVAAMMGDIRQSVCLGVFHSKVDPPSPHFDRAKGIYGSHTPEGKIEVHDEREKRSLFVQNGTSELIDDRGNRTIETAGGAKLFLGADGDTRVENQYGTFGLSKDGGIKATNGATTFSLGSDGAVDIALDDSESIKFTPFGTYISGQKDPVARDMAEVKKNAYPALSKSSVWETQLLAIATEIEAASDYTGALELLYQLDELLEEVVAGTNGVTNSIAPLTALAKNKDLDLGVKILGQIDNFRDRSLTKIAKKYSGGFSSTAIDNLPGELESILDKKYLQGLDFDKLRQTLKSLQHSPDLQMKAVLEQVSPLGEIDSVLSSELYKNTARLESMSRRLDELEIDKELDKIDTLGENGAKQLESIVSSISSIANIAPPISAAQSKALVEQLKSVTSQLKAAKNNLKSQLDSAKGHLNKITELKNNFDLEKEFGGYAVEGINNLLGCVEEIAPVVPKAIALEALTTALLELNDIDEQDEVYQLATLLPQIQEFLDTTEYNNLVLEADDSILIAEAMRSVEALTYDISTVVIPEAVRNLVAEFASSMAAGKTALQFLDRNISSKTTSGGITLDDSGAQSATDSGNTGGGVVQDKDCAALFGPGAKHGLGAKVVVERDRAVMTAAGDDVGLAGKVEATSDGVEIKAPGAALGLGTMFNFLQEKATIIAPGGQSGIGSIFEINQDSIGLYAPGGDKGAGGAVLIEDESVRVSAPGGEKGSSLLVNIDETLLAGPGGTGGAHIKLRPDKVLIKYPGVTGNSIVMKDNNVKIELPILQSSIQMGTSGISLKTLLGKVTVNQAMIQLSMGGSSIRLMPGIIQVTGFTLVNGQPLIPGNSW